MITSFQIGPGINFTSFIWNSLLLNPHIFHSIIFRYRHEFKCDELWLEIKFVLDNFAKPLTDLLNVSRQCLGHASISCRQARRYFSHKKVWISLVKYLDLKCLGHLHDTVVFYTHYKYHKDTAVNSCLHMPVYYFMNGV